MLQKILPPTWAITLQEEVKEWLQKSYISSYLSEQTISANSMYEWYRVRKEGETGYSEASVILVRYNSGQHSYTIYQTSIIKLT